MFVSMKKESEVNLNICAADVKCRHFKNKRKIMMGLRF